MINSTYIVKDSKDVNGNDKVTKWIYNGKIFITEIYFSF